MQPLSDPSNDDAEAAAPSGRAFGGRLRDERAILRALLFSLILHVVVVAGIRVAAWRLPETRIAFEASAGVALMARLGMLAEGDPDAEMPDEIPDEIFPESADSHTPPEDPPDETFEDDELDDDDEAPDVDPEEVAETDDEDDAPDEEQRDDDDAGQSDDAAAPELVAVPETDEERRAREQQEAIERRERRARRAARAEAEERERVEREEEQRRAEQAQAAQEAAAQEDRDPMSLPPSQRYPEGTLNPIATDIGMWGPEAAKLVVIMRNDRIRRSVHRRNIETILAGLPDWNDLVGGADIDVFGDVDAMLIASSDPRYISYTFIAAVHRINPTEVVARLSSGYPAGVTWTEERGRLIGNQTVPRICPSQGDPNRVCDPRVFYVPTQNLFVFTRPEFMDALRRGAPTPRGLAESTALVADEAEMEAYLRELRGETAPEDDDDQADRPMRPRDRLADRTGGSDGGASSPRESSFVPTRFRPRGNPPLRGDGWVRGLLEIGEFGGTGAVGPALTVTTGAFADFQVEGITAGPPQSLHASVYVENDPRVEGRLVFASGSDAQSFVGRWPQILENYRVALAPFGMFGPMRDATWDIDHNEANFTFTIPRSTVDRAATTVSVMSATRRDR